MINEMMALYTKYETNFVRSAMAPETIVAEVAANTNWKKKKAKLGIPRAVPWSVFEKITLSNY